MKTQQHPDAQPHRSFSPRRALVITAVAAAALLGGAAVAAADTDDGPGSSTPTTSESTGTASAGAADGSTDPATTNPAPPAHAPHLDGEVSAVNSSSILITDHDGFTRTIAVTDSTTYGDGIALPIEVGEQIHAEGTVAADGTSLDATVIAVAPEPPAPGTGGPAGGPGLGGPPAPPSDGSAPALPAAPTDDSAPTTVAPTS